MTIIAEPTFIASLNGLRGFIIVIDVGEVDAFTPSGKSAFSRSA